MSPEAGRELADLSDRVLKLERTLALSPEAGRELSQRIADLADRVRKLEQTVRFIDEALAVVAALFAETAVEHIAQRFAPEWVAYLLGVVAMIATGITVWGWFDDLLAGGKSKNFDRSHGHECEAHQMSIMAVGAEARAAFTYHAVFTHHAVRYLQAHPSFRNLGAALLGFIVTWIASRFRR